ncbi:MAG: indolepyruvate ferredoxin oxidoreductase subunit alpha [Spirochaetes bacterium]|nr:indolepyruvate ferredoxin oxidoreductase subunit alpha [Spirochaetota bacterium]
MKRLLSGNEAFARGAYEGGVAVASGYPGTPSTEILENLVSYGEVYCEWSPNEKVALEVAAGAAMTGVRAMATMKHVGLNVAADPLMTLSYTGIEGGLVVLVCDDPGMHSSQNEQDSRNYARFAKVPLIEPSDSDEARRYVGLALEISEQFDTPVILRGTTRISHSKGVVETEQRRHTSVPRWEKKPQKYLMVPLYARQRRVFVQQRLERLTGYAERLDENKTILRDRRIGIITSGISYQYVEEVFSEASILKLAMSYPFPRSLIEAFAREVEILLVVEELDGFITDYVRSLGITPAGTDLLPRIGELSPDTLEEVKARLFPETKKKPAPFFVSPAEHQAPPRPPVLCPGCPHRSVFYALKKFKPVVIGDIGCYSLGGLKPLESLDTILCMGAGISAAMGVSKSGIDRPVVGILGDSTFFHSGITGLLDIGYNRGDLVIIVLDNRVTAMTGHQEHPGTGRTLSGESTFSASIERFASAAGIERIRVFDPYDMKETENALDEEIARKGCSLLISRRPCILRDKSRQAKTLRVDPDRCRGCGLCLGLGCPAIEKAARGGGEWTAQINPALCTGCGICGSICPFDAIGE